MSDNSVVTESAHEQILCAVVAAGEAILAVRRQSNLMVERKTDSSPVTQADRAAHHILMTTLDRLPYGPVLSEEGREIPWSERQTWSQYWLVDPLDGTKEFVKGRDEFTVNVALIRDGQPVFGVVSAPALGLIYVGARPQILERGAIAWKAKLPHSVQHFRVKNLKQEPLGVTPLPRENTPWRIVGSRLHQSIDSKDFLACFPNYTITSIGSSLKFCYIAEGLADLYPRLTPTSEWDTAAAHAVLNAAGGQVINPETGESLQYNTGPSLINPQFIACSARSPLWHNAWVRIRSN